MTFNKKTDKWAAVEPSKAKTVIRMIKNGWSFSRYALYDLCAAKAAYKLIDKLPEPPAPALDRGTLIHKQAENFIKGLACPKMVEGGPYPKLDFDGNGPADMEFHEPGVGPEQLGRFSTLFMQAARRYKKKSVLNVVEDTWAFTKDWKPCSPTDWDNCWLRIKVDYAFSEDGETLYIYDWKTGKFDPRQNEEYLKALQLYALGGMLAHPHIKRVVPKLAYLDLGAIHPEDELEYDRSDIPKLKKLWEGRVAPMFADRRFAPRPNSKCGWCAYSKARGGPCQY